MRGRRLGAGHLRLVEIGTGRQRDLGSVVQTQRITRVEIHARRARIHRVREIAPAGRAKQALRREVVQKGTADATREIRREHNAVIDVDLVEVRTRREGIDRIPSRPNALVERGLGFERLRTERLGHRIGHGKRLVLKRHSADEVRRGRAKPLLRQMRRTEPGAHRGPQREGLRDREARRELARALAAKIIVVLEAAGRGK